MSDVINFNEFKEKNKPTIDKSFENHSYVMDICDEVFENGAVLITLSDENKPELSVSNIELEEVLEMLIACAIKIQKE